MLKSRQINHHDTTWKCIWSQAEREADTFHAAHIRIGGKGGGRGLSGQVKCVKAASVCHCRHVSRAQTALINRFRCAIKSNLDRNFPGECHTELTMVILGILIELPVHPDRKLSTQCRNMRGLIMSTSYVCVVVSAALAVGYNCILSDCNVYEWEHKVERAKQRYVKAIFSRNACEIK